MSIDCLLEEFDFSPHKLFGEEYEFSVLYEETQREHSSIVTETNKNVNKKNILQKILTFIKKIFSLIGRGIKNIINFLKSLFKKKSKSADQIVINIGFKFKKREPNDKKSNSDISNTPTGSNHAFSVPIPSNPKSEVSMPADIKLIYKDLMVKLNGDNTISMNLFDTYASAGTGYGNKNKAPGHKLVRKADSLNAMALMLYPKMMDELISISSMIKDVFPDKDASKLLQRYREWKAGFNGIEVQYNENVSLDAIIMFQSKLNTIMDNFSIVDDIHIDTSKTNNDALYFFNDFGAFCERVQMGINTISGALQKLYIVDARYFECIDNINDLSKFIDDAILSGMPPKYISYNAYILSTKALKGDGKHGSETRPCWGQTRVVFFPDDNESKVHKVALNGFGIRCNKIEYQVTELFENNGGKDLIAPIIDTTNTFTIVSAERINMRDFLPDKSISSLKSDLSEFIKSHNLPIDIGDLHSGNIGVRGNNYVVADYGGICRI